MPELPEVEGARLFLLDHCPPGTVITSVVAAEQGGGPRDGSFDDIVIDCTATEIIEALSSKTLTGIERKGKQLWFSLASCATKAKKKQIPSAAVLFHFGMTGAFVLKDRPYPQYQNFRLAGDSWPPRFTKLELHLSNGERLAFCDPRRLGRVRVRADPLGSPPIASLARDPITDGLTADDIKAALGGRGVVSAPIKAVLLDQERVCCGIGNWVADEVLHQAKIHPATKANLLTEEDISNLSDAINSVLSTAVRVRADSSLFPEHWVFHKRWRSNRGKTDSGLSFVTVGGRTSAFDPSVQKERKEAGSGAAGNTKRPPPAAKEEDSNPAVNEKGTKGKKRRIKISESL